MQIQENTCPVFQEDDLYAKKLPGRVAAMARIS